MIILLEMDKDRWARMMLHDTFRLGAKSSQEGSRTSGGVLGGMGQHGCPQLPRPIPARTAVSLGSSKVSEHWKGFLPPLCWIFVLQFVLQFGWKTFLLLSVPLAGNPKDTNTQSQDRWSMGILCHSWLPWALTPAEPSKQLLPLARGPFFWPYSLLPAPAMAVSGQVGGGGGEDREIRREIEIDFKCVTMVEILKSARLHTV